MISKAPVHHVWNYGDDIVARVLQRRRVFDRQAATIHADWTIGTRFQVKLTHAGGEALVGDNWSRVFAISKMTSRSVCFYMVGVDGCGSAAGRQRRALDRADFWRRVHAGEIRKR
jgi:hypothetical protein